MEEQTEDEIVPERKYVSVVYHHISYQDTNPGDIRDDQGNLHMVSRYDSRPKIPDYLPLTSLSTLIFVPIGILGVLNSLQVRKALKMSDINKARDASDKAIQKALSAFFVGPLVFLIFFVLIYILYNNL